MIILIVHDLDIFALKAESNSPVSTHINCPGPGSVPFQLVKSKPWKAHVFRLSGSVEATEYQTEPFLVLGLDPRSFSGFEEAL